METSGESVRDVKKLLSQRLDWRHSDILGQDAPASQEDAKACAIALEGHGCDGIRGQALSFSHQGIPPLFS